MTGNLSIVIRGEDKFLVGIYLSVISK